MTAPQTPGRGDLPAGDTNPPTVPAAAARTEPNWKIDNCGSCYRPIIWAVTRHAKDMPVDAEPPTQGGNIRLEHRGGTKPLAMVLTKAELTRVGFGAANLRTSHFATCTHPEKWRRRAAGRRS